MADDDAPDTEGDGQEHDDQEGQDQQREKPSRNSDRGQQRATRTGSRDQGQQDTSLDDGPSDDKTFTQDDVDRLIADRIARERKKFGDYDQLKKKAAEHDKAEDAKKTELEKLNDQLTSAQVELQGFKVDKIRREAADQAGLPAKYAKYITAADETEALEQAKELAAEFKAPEPKQADFRQGSRQPAKPAMTRDELIRGMAGY